MSRLLTVVYKSVLPGWRESLSCINLALASSDRATWDTLASSFALINHLQGLLRDMTSGGGPYASEATLDNPDWKTNYYGGN